MGEAKTSEVRAGGRSATGALAERALVPVLPAVEDFPYALKGGIPGAFIKWFDFDGLPHAVHVLR